MNIIGLYVYAPTTFSFPTNTKIESIEGESLTVGEVTLQTGVYRLATNTTPVATSGPSATTYQPVTINTKGGLPDPPLAPIKQYTMQQIAAFFDGAGTPSNILQ